MHDEAPDQQEGKTSKFLDLISKMIEILENIPKALAGLLLIISLIGGATGVYGAVVPEAESRQNTDDIVDLKQRIRDLEIENQLQRELIFRTLSAHGLLDDKLNIESFIVDVREDEIIPLK